MISFASITAQYKNIIFDLGGVILDGGPKYFIADTARKDPATAQILAEISKSTLWHQWVDGLITQKELLETLSHSFDKIHVQHLIASALCTTRPFIDETVCIIRNLKIAGYKLYILSNFSREAYEMFIIPRALFKQFDGMLFSFEAHYFKPEREIYVALLEQYALIPQESIFIDDAAENVDAAKKLGLGGIVFKKGTLEAELLKSGIEVKNNKIK